ncbi:MAG TPA: hypothetical protein VKZ96_17140 [Thermomicrobiales bacterium]|nr:hypothetical protein [Thermomicrobiales bacterium]
MMLLILALVVAFALAQTLVIERLWREQRRARNELEEVYQQVDALAVSVDRQVLTQEQINDQLKPVAAAIKESNQVVVETMDALVETVRAAKAERRQLRDLIEKSSALRSALPVEVAAQVEQIVRDKPAPAKAAVDVRQPAVKPEAPIEWPETNGQLDITAVARRQGKSRSEVALAQRLGRTASTTMKRRAIG